MPKFVWREKNTQLDKGNDLLQDQQKEQIPFITLPKHFIGSNIALLHQTALICKFTNSPLSSEIISRWAKDNWFGLKEIFPVDSTSNFFVAIFDSNVFKALSTSSKVGFVMVLVCVLCAGCPISN